jgi:hypothetical protein
MRAPGILGQIVSFRRGPIAILTSASPPAAAARDDAISSSVARRAGGDVPRWFNEGWRPSGAKAGLGDRARVALAVIDDGGLPVTPVSTPPSRQRIWVHSAYALAGDLVRDLMARHRRDSAARILAWRRPRGALPRSAFFAVTGERLSDFETRYWEHRTFVDAGSR